MGVEDLLTIPFALMALAVGVGLGAAPTVVLLKRKYVLFGVGLLLVVLGVPGVVSGNAESTAPAWLGLVVWVVAASRLSWPGSVWARWAYGPQKAEAARQRAPAPPQQADDGALVSQRVACSDTVPVPAEVAESLDGPPQARPRALGVALTLTAVGLLLAAFFLGGVILLPFAGVVLPFARLLHAGWARARTVLAVGAGLVTAGALALALPRAAIGPYAAVGVVGVLLLVAGVVMLYRGPGAVRPA